MFYDSAGLDALYEETQGSLRFGVFDRRVLLPMDALPEAVERETGAILSPGRVGALIEAGWLQALTTEGGDTGFPLYIPGRIGLLLQCEAAGYLARELAAFAEYEDGVIESVLVADDTPYEDDDLALVTVDAEEQVEALERKLRYATGTPPATWLPHGPDDVQALEQELAAARGSLDALRQYRWERLRPVTQERIRRHAFKLRLIHEQTRVMMCQTDRAIVAQGYSFFCSFGGYEMTGLEYDAFIFSRISWGETLRSPWLTGESDALPIRLPGLIIEGDTVAMTKLMSPAEYQRAWARFELDDFRLALAARSGERLCQRCLEALPAGSSARRKFCSEACKSQAKAETYRERHPDRVKASRHR